MNVELTLRRSGMMGVEVCGNRDVAILLRTAVLAYAGTAYKVRHEAAAFLQGYNSEEGWVLVEFWTNNLAACQAFVDYINSHISN